MRLRNFSNWLGDSLRFAGALLYWNARKSAYVLRQRRGPCPCQNPSDDSIPGRVRCDAVTHWHQPARFRPVCPLLVRTAEGWCCSVAASSVRPFWGRALVFGTAILLALYLVATFAIAAGLRTAGRAPVTWVQVAWPGKWSEIRSAQAETLYARAMNAFMAGRLNEAFLALTSAQQRDPGNYESALLLGQITMFQGSMFFADEVFAKLLQEHPAQLARTAVTYHDTLLALNRFNRLAELGLTMAQTDSGRAALWVRTMLVAVRASGGAEELVATHAGQVARLAPHAQMLLRAEAKLDAGDRAGAVAELRGPFRGPLNLIYMQQQVERLAALGAPADAQLLLDFYGPLMGDFEHALTQLALDSIAGDAESAAASMRRLVSMRLSSTQVERFAVRLVEYPSAGRFRELHRIVAPAAGAPHEVNASALWMAAIICGAGDQIAFWREEARRATGEPYPEITRLNFASRNLADANSIAHLINAVTLPRDIILALVPKVGTPPAQP